MLDFVEQNSKTRRREVSRAAERQIIIQPDLLRFEITSCARTGLGEDVEEHVDAVRRDGVDHLDFLEDPQRGVPAPDGEVDHERRLEHALGRLGHLPRVGVHGVELIQPHPHEVHDEKPCDCGDQASGIGDSAWRRESPHRPHALTSEKAHAEAKPHISCRRFKDGSAGGAYDTAKNVGSEREFVLREKS